MNDPRPSPAADPQQPPGHYGAGYGEQVPEGAPPQLGPTTDGTARPDATAQPAAASGDANVTSEGDDGAPVDFTPEDVHARPPDHTPTDGAPESEKAALIFERS